MKKFNSDSNGLLYILAIFAGLVLLNLVGYGIYRFYSNLTAVTPEDPVKRTVFVLSDDEKVYFTDVLVYYPESKRGFVIDVPGNTGGIFNSLDRVDRVDAVYKEIGIEKYRDEVAGILGIKSGENELDFVEMKIDSFKVLVDLLGGLKIFIPSPVDISTKDGDRWLLPSGAVNLDGDKVFTYLAYEDKDEKYETYEERRKTVFVAFLSALAKNSQYMSDNSRFSIYSKRLNSNLDDSELQTLIIQISAGEFEGLRPMSINGQERRIEGADGVLLFPEFDGRDIKRVVQLKTNSLISSKGVDVSRIYVLEIQNGTSVQGLAHNTAIYFRGAGYDVLSTLNADNEYDKTVIINHIGETSIAKNLGDYIHCTNIVDDEVNEDEGAEIKQKNVDFTIILGKDFDGRFVR